MSEMDKPIKRSFLRRKLGMGYYSFMRRIFWIKMKDIFAADYEEENLPYVYFSHRTLMLRKLKDVDMWMQHNKIVNLKIACKKLNHIIIRPGQTFSYWKLIGKPSRSKGYVDGMVLRNGTFHSGVGGGLCQMSNLIFWMAIHTPLTIVERHRHGYDVFPDSNRTQPFGSGATCFYPHGDLMIKNETEDIYQINISVGEEYLEGEIRGSRAPEYQYKVIEKNHLMKAQYWGGYSRHNELYQEKYDLEGNLVEENFLLENSAIMMYTPFLQGDLR